MIQRRLLFLRKLLKSFKEFVVYVLSDGGVVEAREYVNTQMEKAQNASILQIPSAFKTDVLYNQIPINPSEDFDVVRNSNVWRTNRGGILENIGVNVPCIDYTDGFPVLLTQPQSTNFIKNSSTLSLQSVAGGSFVTDNASISPENIQNAAILESGSGGGLIFTQLTFTSTSAAQLVTFSYHVKYVDNQWARLRLFNFNATCDVFFDILNGVIGTNSLPLEVTAKIEPLKNGWYRISITREFDFSTDRAGTIRLDLANGDNTSVQVPVGNKVALYEPQAEELGYATTPIKTGAAVVSRLQDEITGAGSNNTINSEEGVLYVERATIDIFSGNYIALNDGSTSNRVYIYVNTTQIRCGANINGVSQGTQGDLANIYDFNKIALVYDSDSVRLYLNENPTPIATLTITDIQLPNTLTKLNLGTGGANVSSWDKTKELRVYKSIAEAQIDLPYIT